MPLYRFHLFNDIEAPDEEGMELPDIVAANAQAIDSARDLASAAVREGRLDLNHRIDIEDEGGTVLLSVAFRDAVDVRH